MAPRRLTSRSRLDNLKREAKRWLAALRADDGEARARLARALPDAPAAPTLRDVQHALAREHGLTGWDDLLRALRSGVAAPEPASRDEAIGALLAAAERGDADAVARTLDAFPDIVDERAVLPPHTGRRGALHFAIGGPHEAVVDALLDRGADPDLRDEGDNAMPIHFAAERGHLGIVRRLVERGADPIGEGDGHELEVIGWAVCFDYAFHRDVAEYLLAHGARHTIFSAVAMGDAATIRATIARAPAELDRPMDGTNRRRRPLHLAVVKRRPDSLATLLELGADTEATDAAGLTPLDQAALAGEVDMAGLLIAAGAEVRVPAAVSLGRAHDLERLLRDDPHALRPGGRWGRLIVRAAERAPGSVIDALVRAGASVHVRDDHRTAVDGTHGYTALHAAAFHGNADAARALLAHGANPADREDKYWGTPASWADHAGHADVRDLILRGRIDVFDAVRFDRSERIPEILDRDPEALERKLGAYVTGEGRAKAWLDVAWTPLAFAAAWGKLEALRLLLDRGADATTPDSAGRTPLEIARTREHAGVAALLEERAARAPTRPDRGGDGARVADFLLMACADWRVSGYLREARARDAARLLARDPSLATRTVHTAVVGGDAGAVRRVLDERPEAVSEIGGPRRWPPILYLCGARLPAGAAADEAPEILRLLLDRGADPNAFYLGGNADIHYTALTCLLGRGEEMASMHRRAREMAALLLERGADPHDNQVLYNVFADNTSRHLLTDDIVWLLELMYEHSMRRGHAAAWRDSTWPMFDMRGAPSLGDEGRVHHGARFLLDAAVDRDLLGMAEWLLEHGAGPNTPPGELWRGRARRTLYEDAVVRGHREMAELLVRYGARRSEVAREGIDHFIDACLASDDSLVRSLVAAHPEYLRDHRPLYAAVQRNRADVVERLLDLGVSPDLPDPGHRGKRPLHHDAVDVAKVLIERGAEVDARDGIYGSTPIGWASYFERPRMIAVLGAHSRDVWTLTFRGLVERLREVLREEPGLARAINDDGQSLLFWLPSDDARALEIAELLLGHGADPALRDGRGATAEEVAERRGLDGVVELLRARASPAG